ncbi:polysaccharide deacetylase family protein [Paenibacillus sp. P26]|nr:polysaccharide deacetylase family protein [Paenibacillus sp. P26]UUZ94892.1 polysaccharide deacetylase family protein [Paenibacillus sp. P25]
MNPMGYSPLFIPHPYADPQLYRLPVPYVPYPVYPMLLREPRVAPPHTGGPERPEERPPHTVHVDWASRFPNEIILHGPARREVALTFDDGPDDEWTPKVLDVLKSLGVKATFFCVGQRIEQHPHVFQRILREGHVAGNHTWDHPNLTKISIREVDAQIRRTDDIMFRLGKVRPALFRPPYGALNEPVIREIMKLKDKIVFWNVDSLDWAKLTAVQVSINILSHVRPGSIILQHSAGGVGESLQDTVDSLPYTIRTLHREGYTFRTVPGLVRIAPYK